MRLVQPRGRQRDQRDPDRHVDPEDPVPADAIDHGTADERPERDGEAGDAAPGADREAALALGERGGEQRERERRDDRPTRALQGPGGDQRAGGRRERGERTRHGEQGDAGDEHALAPEPITERGTGHQQHGIRERVGVDRPFEILQTPSEVLADRRQRGRDDEVVEHDHEESDRNDREGPERTVATRADHGK
jgi:hypothetical protein